MTKDKATATPATPAKRRGKTKHFGRGNGFVMEHDVKPQVRSAPMGHLRTSGLQKIDSLQRADTANLSDPFKWPRVRAHFLSGILTMGDLNEKTLA